MAPAWERRSRAGVPFFPKKGVGKKGPRGDFDFPLFGISLKTTSQGGCGPLFGFIPPGAPPRGVHPIGGTRSPPDWRFKGGVSGRGNRNPPPDCFPAPFPEKGRRGGRGPSTSAGLNGQQIVGGNVKVIGNYG
jgi:hypothetical protein